MNLVGVGGAWSGRTWIWSILHQANGWQCLRHHRNNTCPVQQQWTSWLWQ